MFNVGGWLAHGDFALDAGVDFLAVVEHQGTGLRCDVVVFVLSGLLPARKLFMLISD